MLLALAAACVGGGVARPPSQPEKLSFAKGPEGKLRVSDGGLGEPAVVLLHGLGGTWEVWRGQLAHLRESHRAVALDLRGHGDSEPPKDESGYTADGMAADVDAVVSALKLDRVVLVGHSMAGAVLTRYAALHPERVAGLVYVDALGDFSKLPPESVQKMLEADKTVDVQKAFDPMLGDKARPATKAMVHDGVAKLQPGAFQAIRRSVVAYRAAEDAARYTGPAACIDAGADFPILAYAMIARCQRTSLRDVSHWLMLDDPTAFGKALDAALETMK